MCEKSTVVGVVSLAILATVIGSSLARSNVTNATNGTLSTNSESAVKVASHAQATPSVLAATAMMASTIGLVAALRQRASSEVVTKGDQKRKRNHRSRLGKIVDGGGKARRQMLTAKDEQDKKWKKEDFIKFIKGKVLDGVDIEEWKEISQVVKENLANADAPAEQITEALEQWEEADQTVQQKLENGEEIDWEAVFKQAEQLHPQNRIFSTIVFGTVYGVFTAVASSCSIS